jgi:hypothetical protein
VHVLLTAAALLGSVRCLVPKSYAAELEIRCPGGALSQTGPLKSPVTPLEQSLCQRRRHHFPMRSYLRLASRRRRREIASLTAKPITKPMISVANNSIIAGLCV